MRKSRNLVIYFVSILLLIILLLNLFSNSKNKNLLNKIYKDVFSNLTEEQYEDVTNVFISLYDEKEQAIVNNGQGDNAKEALSDAINKSLKTIDRDYKIKLVKLDFVNDVLPALESSVNFYVNQSYGIAFDENFSTDFLNEELILGNLWINNDKDGNLTRLNKYLQSQNKNTVEQLPENYYVFKTIKMSYEDGKLISSNLEPREENIHKSDILDIMNNATEYLIKQQKEDGSFVYGYNASTDTLIDGYNIVRHCGTLVALAEQASLNKEKSNLKETIQNGISYIEKHSITSSDNESLYIYQTENDNSIKLGSNALALLAVTKYMEVYGTDEYLEFAKKLANGIVSMQDKNTGQFTFLLNFPDLAIIDSERYAYYEGEATYALARFYGISKDITYLNSAVLATDYFVLNDYAKYQDHWISYAVNELTKYISKQEYFDLGIKNYMDKKNGFLKFNQISNTDFELLMNTLELYKRFDVEYDDELLQIINKAFISRLQDYLFKDEAMYFSNPLKYQNTFCVKDSSYRIRIDDVQHSLSGMYLYYKNIDNLK